MSSAARIEIFDCSPENSVKTVPVMELLFPTDHITVEELIRQRVVREVDRFLTTLEVDKSDLVKITEDERRLIDNSKNQAGQDLKERQCVRALRAFQGNQFFVIVNDTQVTHLDESIVVTDSTQVEFFRLRPLVGG